MKHIDNVSNVLTFHGVAIKGLLTVVVPAFSSTAVVALYWPKTSLSNALLDRMPVSPDLVPYFTIMYVLTVWLLSVLCWLFGFISTRGAADNKNPRGAAKDSSTGWVYLVHCAHDNTTEFMVVYTACLFVAKNTNLDPVLIAKWSILVMLSRTVYPFFYVLSIDALRTCSYAVGFFACFIMGWTAVFQESMLPYCTIQE